MFRKGFIGVAIAGSSLFPVQTAFPAEYSGSYLKTDKQGLRVKLCLGKRTFVPKSGQGPEITLYGVQHVADRAFYTGLQERLAKHDVVLYELLRPVGVDPRVALDARGRVLKSEIALRAVKVLLERHKEANGTYPARLDDYAGKTPEERGWFALARRDAWGRALDYSVSEDGASFRLRSLGADGAEGGEGEDADLDFADQIPLLATEAGIHVTRDPKPNGIGLYHQNHVLDVGGDRFLRSDISAHQMSQWMAREGGDWESTRKSFETQPKEGKHVSKEERGPAEMMRVLQMIRKLEMGYRAALISRERLPEVLKASLKVTIDDRNQVVVDDLKAILAGATRFKSPKSVGILYGAGHMLDLQDRIMEQLGYKPADFDWMTAIDIEVPAQPK